MIYEISNPSDPYTLRTDDFKCAAVAIFILGRGRMGLRSLDGSESTPVFFGWDEWFREHGITDINKFIKDNKEKMAEILETVLIGSSIDREDVERTLPLLPEDQRQKWLNERHNLRRSSITDIGNEAWVLARELRVLF